MIGELVTAFRKPGACRGARDDMLTSLERKAAPAEMVQYPGEECQRRSRAGIGHLIFDTGLHNGRFDRVEIANGPGGASRTLTFDEFWSLGLVERVTLIKEGAMKFFLRGEPGSPWEAIKR